MLTSVNIAFPLLLRKYFTTLPMHLKVVYVILWRLHPEHTILLLQLIKRALII